VQASGCLRREKSVVLGRRLTQVHSRQHRRSFDDSAAAQGYNPISWWPIGLSHASMKAVVGLERRAHSCAWPTGQGRLRLGSHARIRHAWEWRRVVPQATKPETC